MLAKCVYMLPRLIRNCCRYHDCPVPVLPDANLLPGSVRLVYGSGEITSGSTAMAQEIENRARLAGGASMLNLDYDRLSRVLIEAGAVTPAIVRWGKVKACSAGLLRVSGFHYPIGSGATVLSEDGHEVGAEVVGFDGSMATLAPFDEHAAIGVDALVKPGDKHGTSRCWFGACWTDH